MHAQDAIAIAAVTFWVGILVWQRKQQAVRLVAIFGLAWSLCLVYWHGFNGIFAALCVGTLLAAAALWQYGQERVGPYE